MTYRTIVGVDPSLSATGIATLELVGDPGAWRVSYRTHVGAPGPAKDRSLVDRLAVLEREVRGSLLAALVGRQEPMLVVAEDPSDYRAPKAGGPSQRTKFGAGVGVVLLTARHVAGELGIQLETFGTAVWLPTQAGRRGGGWRYKMPHKDVLAQTRRLVPGTQEATDDETMAAALAFWRALHEAPGR